MWLDSKAIGFAHYWQHLRGKPGVLIAICHYAAAGSNDVLPEVSGYREKIQQRCQACIKKLAKLEKKISSLERKADLKLLRMKRVHSKELLDEQ